ncbi:hypothetical protein GGH15_005512 [Coemansia sp. RSA 562]|nr:hypothetical protein GGH15_005512 [Coemansia sp. RSA 562]
MYDDVWFVPELEGSQNQATLPTILVDGPYNAPMENFFEYHANIIVAAGIGITPYIAALEHVLDQCASNIPVRTTQTTRDGLLPQCIYLVWVFRDISMLCLLLPALQRLRTDPRAREIVVPCLYVTGAVNAEHETTMSDVFGRPMVRLSNGIRVSQGRPPLARMVSYMAGKHPNSRMGTDPEVAETEPASVSEGSSKIFELFLDESKVAETETTSVSKASSKIFMLFTES